jgi:hypothetical protein
LRVLAHAGTSSAGGARSSTFKRVRPKVIDDAPRRDRPDPFHQPATQIRRIASTDVGRTCVTVSA